MPEARIGASMDVLSIVHGEGARACLFAEVIRESGHRLDEWSLGWGKPLPQPLDAYDAVIVFGGAMHADQDDHHPWLRDENFFLERLLDLRLPVLGVCLGAQLIAKAAHAWVGRASEPEIGWVDVELTEAAAADPVLSHLPPTFEAFQWHYYTHGLPAGAVELARSEACMQAFRLGANGSDLLRYDLNSVRDCRLVRDSRAKLLSIVSVIVVVTHRELLLNPGAPPGLDSDPR